MLDQITPLLLTYNEAPNIRRTLERLWWASDIVIVDSFSQDDTAAIAKSFPAVRFQQREFDSHQNQWNFGLDETGITTSWVLALDADYVLTDEVIAELKQLHPETTTGGYRANFIYCVKGQRLRSGVYPPVTVLYRRKGAVYILDGHTQRITLDGGVADLQSPILHDDRKGLSRWFHSQVRYTELEAQKLWAAAPGSLSLTDRIRRWRILAPPAMLFYCLIVRGGVFDGWPGFYYAFQRSLAELMLSLYLIDYSLGKKKRAATSTQESPLEKIKVVE